MTGMIGLIARAARRCASTVDEMNYAQRRTAVLLAAPDRHLARNNRAPDSYAEFLFRTSGPLRCEPSAARRADGRLVR